MTDSQYQMDGTELFLHQLINDSRVKYDVLDIDEVVKDLARLNWIKQVLELDNIDFTQCILDYRKNLIYHLENVK